MKKRIFLSVGMGLAALFAALSLASCGGSANYTVNVLLTEGAGYTILSENPVEIPAGSDAAFTVQLDEGYNFVQADDGGVWTDGTLTIPAVQYPATVNMIASDATEKVKVFVENDTGGGIVSMGTDEFSFYPGARVVLTAEAHEGNYFAGWTLGKSMDKGGTLLSLDSTYEYEITKRAEIYGNFYPIVTEKEEPAVSSQGSSDNLTRPTQDYGGWGIQGNESIHTIEYKANHEGLIKSNAKP